VQFQSFASFKISGYRNKASGKADIRLTKLNEAVSSIKVVKLANLAKSLIERIEKIRMEELKIVKLHLWFKGSLAGVTQVPCIHILLFYFYYYFFYTFIHIWSSNLAVFFFFALMEDCSHVCVVCHFICAHDVEQLDLTSTGDCVFVHVIAVQSSCAFDFVATSAFSGDLNWFVLK
jgi:hypothetical protein